MGLFGLDEEDEMANVAQPLPSVMEPDPLEPQLDKMLAENGMAPQPLSKSMNPMVLDSLSQKYGLDKYSPEARNAIQAQNAEDRSGPNWAAGLSALGAGIQGKDAGAAGQAILRQQEMGRQNKLADFDQSQTHAKQALAFDQSQDKMKRENDPNSAESKIAQGLFIKMNGDPELAKNMTAAKFKEFGPLTEKMFSIEQRSKDAALAAQDRKDRAKELAAERGERDKDRKQSAADRADEKNRIAEEKKNEREMALKTPYGLANTTEDAKNLKDAYESKKDFDSQLDEMIALRKKHHGGAILNREDVARGKQLSKDLLLQYKNMAKLGVLSKSDEDIINAIIPSDPLEYSFTPGQDPVLHKLEKFKQDKNNEFETKVATRTRDGGASLATNSTVKMIAPDGSVRSVPKNQVAAALKSGGKLANDTAVAGSSGDY